LRRVEKIVQALESAGSPAEIPQLKHLQGHARLYRVRIGDWRLGLHIDGNQVDCVRILHRREIYRYFP
jgi:mRNA interferase RelE/StbE